MADVAIPNGVDAALETALAGRRISAEDAISLTGINDFGGISPVTKDFINPDADWPQVFSLAARTAAAGFVLRERLAIYPEFSSCREFLTDRLRMRVESPRDEHGYARSNPC